MGGIFSSFGVFFSHLGTLMISPSALLLLFGSVLMGIIFGATPGLTATLGVALLTTLTYGMDLPTAMVALMGIYVGGVYGGSYTGILVNIPGTAASAATAMDGYPLAGRILFRRVRAVLQQHRHMGILPGRGGGMEHGPAVDRGSIDVRFGQEAGQSGSGPVQSDRGRGLPRVVPGADIRVGSH